MAACEDLNTSNMETPPGGSSRKRRSWFTPGRAPVAFQLAVQPPSPDEEMIDMTDLEVLTLSHFTRPPKVDFGTIQPGGCVTRHVRVTNPHQYSQQVKVEKEGRDFTLSHADFVVEAESDAILSVEWIPVTVGAYRETVLFKVDGAYKLQATFMGKLEEPPKPKKKVRKTWANKPFVPVRGVLRSSNKFNTNTQQGPPRTTQAKSRSPTAKQAKSRSPTAKQAKSRSPTAKQAKSRSPTAKPAPKRGTRQASTKLKTPPPKRISDPISNVPDPTTYFNPQVPLNPASFIFEKRTMPPGPVDSPVDPRRTTFEKSSPEMANTPTISEKTPPLSMREKVMQPRRIIKERTPSPLAAVRESKEDLENLPPLPFCDDRTPRPKRSRSKMRRSNTYTKLDDSSIQSPTDSEAETTVIETTEMTECVELTEHVEVTDCVEVTEYTQVYEEVVEEQVEYLVEQDGAGRERRTEVSRAVRPVGRHLFSQQVEANTTYQTHHHTNTTYHQDAFDATRVLNRYSDASSVNSSRMSMPAPHHATFVTSPLSTRPNVLSETRVLTPRGSNINNNVFPTRPNVLSETRVLTPRVSNINSSMLATRPNVLSETRVFTPRVSSINTIRESLPISQHDELSDARVYTPTPASPRRFFSDLLALHEGNSSKEDSETFEKTPPQNRFPQPLPIPDPRRVSSLTVTKDRPGSSRDEFVPGKALFENGEFVVDPRRVSTLTVTKSRPGEYSPPVVDPRRVSSLTVTREHAAGKSPQGSGIEGRRLFEATSPRSRQADSTPDSPGVAPLTHSPSPGRQPASTPDSPGVRPLIHSPSPGRQPASTPDSPGVMPLTHSPSPGRQTPTPVHIYGTNYPNSRSLRKLDEDEDEESGLQSASPRKKPQRERTRRRTSGQFRRRSATYQAGNVSLNGSLVARGVVLNDNDDDNQSVDSPVSLVDSLDSPVDSPVSPVDSPVSPVDSPMSLSELGHASDHMAQHTAPPQHTAPLNPCSTSRVLKAGICGPLRQSGPVQPPRTSSKLPPKAAAAKTGPLRLSDPVRQPRTAAKPPVSKSAGAASGAKRAPAANYLRPTSAVQNRKLAVDSKKRDLSSDRRPVSKTTTTTKVPQEHAAKRVRREVSTTQSVVGGLTKTQALRREAALAGMTEKKKSVPAPRRKPKVAQLSLRLMAGANKTALPKHPMAFASKNKYYDERWKEKQERGFVRWLNFILTPPEEECSGADTKQKVDAGALSVITQTGHQTPHQPAPSKETLSFRVYSARRRLNRLRRGACKLFTSETFVHFEQKLEVEAECGRIMVRTDRMIHADVGIKQCILDLLLSYNPLWLRIGLETIYGEMLPITSNADVVGMSRFILTRLLSNPYIAEEYAHPTVPHLYRDGYHQRIAQFSLKQFILLVTFLDLAKTSRLIDHDPCLFCRNSDYKASRDVLLVFSRDYLSGEGDLGKHLTYMGYAVKHVQTPLDELDYAVNNLAIDLRDGTRLTRVMAMLTQRWTLTNELRVPAISRLQKVHNIGVAFKTLANMGLDLSTIKGGKIDARDICDGHREKTLSLLWQIIFKFQVETMLSEEQLRDEVRFLRTNLSVQTRLDAALNDDIDALGIPEERRESIDTDLYFKSPRLSLLLTWCRAVCAYYGVKVENFTVSFSDGRALCLLVHHYHPALLARAEINDDTTQTMGPGAHNVSIDSGADDSFNENWYTSFSPSTGKPEAWDTLVANERENFHLLYDRVNELGNIPVMVRSTDMSNTIPDEKVVITYVSYLCARLLDIRAETRAARVIQAWWRHHQLHRHKEVLQVRQEAAIKIQGVVRSFLGRRREERQVAAAVTIQTAVRGLLARREAARRRLERDMASKTSAVLTIQAYIRTWLVRRRLQRQALAAGHIQAWWRMTRCRRQFCHQRTAATSIQRWYRACRTMQHQRLQYQTLKSAAVCIQAHVRSWLVRQSLLQHQHAAVTIQTWWRMVGCERAYMIQREAAMIIQRQFRACVQGRQQREIYLQLKSAVGVVEKTFIARKLRILRKQHEAAVVIQKHWRGVRAVRRRRDLTRAAVCIQAWVRAQQHRRRFCHMKRAAICIQAYARAWSVRRHQKQLDGSAIVLQSWWRMVRARTAFLKQQHSAVIIQRAFRAVKLSRQERTRYVVLRSAAVVLQRAFMARRARIAVKQDAAATNIQKSWRCHVERTKYRQLRSAAVTVQSWFRAVRQRRRYVRAQRAAVCVQACVRSWQVRQVLQRQSQAAVKVQSWWNMVKVQRLYIIQKAATITLQEHYRAYVIGKLQRTEFLRQKSAAVTIQKQWRCRVEAQKYQETKSSIQLIQRWYRARRARVSYCRQREAAVCIQSYVRGWTVRQTARQQAAAALRLQSWWRMETCRQSYKNQQRAALTIQTRLRATLAARRQQETYSALKAAAVTLQRAFVRRKARIVMKQNHAATTIQKYWRSHQAVQSYNTTKAAVVLIQRWMRAKQQRCRYLELRQAVVCLQAHVRGWLVQRRVQELTAAAVTAQAWWRMVLVRRSYRQRRHAAIIIQEHYRAYRLGRLQQAEYEAVRRAVVTVQKNWRSYCVRARYQKQKEAVVLLQTMYRARRQRERYCQLRQASVCVQSHVRAWLVGRRQRTHYLTVRRLVTALQAAVRAKQQRGRYVNQRQAAIKIQSLWRAYSQRTAFTRLRQAACLIQLHYRGRMLTRQVTTEYVTKKRSAVTVQATWRGYTQRKQYLHMKHAAVVVQSTWRQYHQQKQYQTKKSAAVYIQRWYRAQKLRQRDQREFFIALGAVITLQAAVRGWRVRRWARVIRRLQHAAVTIQTHVRRYQAQRRYNAQRGAALSIQRQYRAWVVGSRQYCNYHITRGASLIIQAQVRGWLKRRTYKKRRNAAITIQAHYKGWAARQRYRRIRTEHAAATLIQAHYRRHRQQRQNLRLRAAVVITQHYYRARLAMRHHRSHFLLKKKATLTIQTAFRGFLARKELQWRKEQHVLQIKTTAVTCIQAHFRRYRQQRQILRLRAAVVVTQHYYRAKLATRYQRSQFLKTKRATITIQTAFRGLQARQELQRRREAKELEMRHSAATIIQAYYRSYREQRRLLRLKAAVVIVQHYYRARLSMKYHRFHFVQKKKATVTIQTAFRGFLARKELQKRQEERVFQIKTTAATCLQAHFRRYRQQRQILRLRAAVVVTQHYYRAKLAMRCQRTEFLETKRATITIQTAFRGLQARQELRRRQEAKELEMRHSSATRIQAYYRSYREQRRLLRLKAAVVIVQHYYRARLSMKYHRFHFVQKKKATVTIQTAFRGFLARKELQQRKEQHVLQVKTTAVTCIQAHFRRYRQQRQLLRLRAAVVVTQHYYRAKLATRYQRSQFLKTKRATITIQTAFRGLQARQELRRRREAKELEMRHSAATSIQAYYRSYREQRRLLRLKAAVVIVQHYYRARLSMRYHRFHFVQKKKATVTIQTAFRGFLARKELQKRQEERVFKIKTTAVTCIQAHFRRYRQQRQILRLRAAVVVTQHYYRAKLAMRYQRTEFLQKKKAAVTVQTAVRQHLARRELRRRQEEKRVHTRNVAATCIQAHYRRYRQQHQIQRLRAAVVISQHYYRARRAMRHQRCHFLLIKRAAVTLQAAVRGCLARRELRQQREASIRIQAVYRCYVARREFVRQRTAAKTIQRTYRGHVQRTQAVEHYRACRRSAVTIQAAYRGYVTRKQLAGRNRSATVVQAAFRRYCARTQYIRMKSAVVVLQVRYRSRLLMIRERCHFVVQRTAATKLQAVVRGYIARRELREKRAAVTVIQSAYRRYRCQKTYVTIRTEHRRRTRAVSVIQRCFRRYHHRKITRVAAARRVVYLQKLTSVTRRYVSVVRIQRAFRKYRSLREAKRQIKSVLVLQRWMRGRLDRMRYVRLRRTVIVVQRKARVYLSRRKTAAITIQTHVRNWLARRRMIRVLRGVRRIQALWRGYQVRRHVTSKVLAARRRIEAANANVTTEKKLGHMTCGALDFLLRCKQLSTIMEALMMLEPATRWSSVCCEQMAASNAAGVLFALIRSCNRSIPHMDIITYSIDILLNLTKYPKTSSTVYEAEGSITTLMRLLTIYREKGSTIFNKACTLLGLLGYPEHRRHEVLAVPQLIDQVRGIHALTLRKYKMEEERNLIKTKMAAANSLSGSFLVSMHNRPTLPRIEPEWLLRRKSVRQMETPLQGTKFVMNALQIAPKK